ncbi:4-hydroxy-tetrahydrodipicolinate reductase [Sphingomonas sp. 37zxx]|uniref:4-hydroxy-tetrahydrodipicolinate reductase n=1 Tax=Sphingomonas sp. 37zxx TaxID=1550073 RepID=UPI00053BFD24|nr:4-hydroxy-tetrahydrodipicolinate reductase [Sphingomonas sp. 37zxx]
MTAIGIYGSLGRMGQSIVAAMPAYNAEHAGGVDVGQDPAPLAQASDVLVDFSSPAALEAHLHAARAAATPIMIGTTGLNQRHHDLIDAAAADIAVLQTGNTSLGVALLSALVRDAAGRLGLDWDIEIAEMHHRDKVDSPSGTALMLGEAAAEGRAMLLSESSVVGRAGLVGARARGTIGFSSLRGGTVVGDHMVVFAGDGERIELSHRAEDRAIFARGAVQAALWLAKQPPGRYTMDQVLGL